MASQTAISDNQMIMFVSYQGSFFILNYWIHEYMYSICSYYIDAEYFTCLVYFAGKCDFKALLSQTQESIDKHGPRISKTTIENILKEEWKVFITNV